jgi:hypothetical protein
VDCIGSSGGLMLLWKKDLQVSVNSFSVGHIDARIKWRMVFCGDFRDVWRSFS